MTLPLLVEYVPGLRKTAADQSQPFSLATFLLLVPRQVAVSYQTLDVLQEHGIAANDIQKLNAAGYHTVESVRLPLVE